MAIIESTSHHFVPQWYQRHFLVDGKGEFYVLDKSPLTAIRCPDGVVRKIDRPRQVRRSGAGALFQQDDLYAVAFPGAPKDVLERALFGPIDDVGAAAHRLFSQWPKTSGVAFRQWDALPKDSGNPADRMVGLLNFLDAQKGRTPKGLDQIKLALAKRGFLIPNNNVVMAYLQWRRQRNCTVWAEGVWEMFSAENSETKFLISDDPVVIYNMDCFPMSAACAYPHDPDPFWRGSRVLYPLSPNRLLVISHAEHFDEPSRTKARRERRNARAYDQTMINFMDIINDRELGADQVVQVNHIIKARASRFIASATKAHLFPEQAAGMLSWPKLDEMFRPEHPSYRSQSKIVAKFNDGSVLHSNAYGERDVVPGWFIRQQEALKKKRNED